MPASTIDGQGPATPGAGAVPGSGTASGATSRGTTARALALRVLPRLVGSLVVLWGAATLAFAIVAFIPGDPVSIMLGAQSQASDATRAQITADLGLNDPLWQRYLEYLARVVQLDFGESYRLRRPVTDVIAAQLPETLALAGLAVLMAVVFALLIAVVARGRVARAVASGLELLAISSPAFWTGILLLTVFSFRLHWFPVSGGQGFGALVLPALTMALPITGLLSQLLRHGLDAANDQPFATTARARGLGPAALLGRHTLRHAALPTVTFSSYIVGSLLGGAVIIEELFGRQGIGRVTLDAVTNRDLPVIMALVVFAAAVFVVINLVVDALYPVLDPRLRGAR